MTRMLADFHHHALGESLALLFTDRYHVDLFYPMGMEWFDEGYWQFERQFHGDRVARQYLEGIWSDAEVTYGIGYLVDKRHPNRAIYGVTLAAAKQMNWDFVLSSLPHNDDGFHRFATEKRARFGIQVGNVMQDSRYDLASFVLASSTLPGHTTQASWGKVIEYQGKPTVIYHQEFDTRSIFTASIPTQPSREVASWVNCFPETSPYRAFLDFARRTKDDFDWRVYGSYGSAADDELKAGDISWVPDIAAAMRQARIGFHMKSWSDGYGHVIHNWSAIGRPIIWVSGYYRDKLAEPLWVEGVNAWDIASHSEAEIVDIMRRLRDDDDFWLRASEESALRFREVVDFDEEARVIGAMLGL